VADLVFSNAITTHTWITDNSGSGKSVSWQTDDDSQVAQYTVSITGAASNSCQNSATTSYVLDV